MAEMTNNLCDYGCGRPAIKTFKTGKSCCSANTSSCPAMKEKNSIAISKVWKEKGNNFWKDGHPRGSTNTIPWNKGLTKETDERVRRIGENVSASAHLYPRTFSEEGLESISYHARKNILSRYEDGWLPKSGRCKKYSYTSPIAGNINVDGTWELLFANWLDFKKFVWKKK